jgi:hypothetical protein
MKAIQNNFFTLGGYHPEYVGEEYNQYTIIGPGFRTLCGKFYKTMVLVKCVCRTITCVSYQGLKNEWNVSCGCTKQRNRRAPQITKEELAELYLDKRLTTTQIAILMKCHVTFIRKKLKEFDISTRFNASHQESLHWKGYEEISGTYWGSIRACAKSRKIPFHISIQEAWDKFIEQDRKCALSGRPIKFNPSYNSEQTASLDRINSADDEGRIGYFEGNFQWIHKDFQWIKNDWDNDEFISMCKEVVNYNQTGAK